MISIILSASDEVKKEAIAAGFKEATVLIRHDPIESCDENKQKLEREIKKMQPHQFLVSDFWGMTIE